MSIRTGLTVKEVGPAIGVGPIVIPGYLERPQLVTRDAKGELEIWSYHRWAESLDLGIAATLAEALAARTGMREFAASANVYRGRLGDDAAFTAARLLAAEIDNPALGRSRVV